MGFVLDTIIREDMIGSRDFTGNTTYETINTTDNTISKDVSGSEQGYLVGIKYVNGVSPNIEFSLEGSIDNVSFAAIPGTKTTITDSSGSITWDIVDSNTNFIRIAWTVSSGSMDIYGQLSAKRRH